MAKDIIRLKNAVFYAYHGVVTDEQNLGGKFEVDAEIAADISSAVEQDSLKKTIDYEALYATIQHLVTARKYYLIETLANAIAEGILQEFPSIAELVIRVRKPHPPVKGVIDHVEVEVHRTRV